MLQNSAKYQLSVLGILLLILLSCSAQDARAGLAKISVMQPGLWQVDGLEEPIMPTGSSSAPELKDLDRALADFQSRNAADVGVAVKPLEEFLAKYPSSSWTMALSTNIGLLYYKDGFFTRALNAWEAAWQAGRYATSLEAKALTDRAVGELARMHARVGHLDRLESLLNEIGDRPLTGSATAAISGAREGAWTMRNDPGRAFLCGPMALKSALLKARPTDVERVKFINDIRSSKNGVSLAEVGEFAKRTSAPYSLVKRINDIAPIPLPAIIHWKINHYAAIVGYENGRYHIADPTFGSDLWISHAALKDESSGYFLLFTENYNPTDWRPVDYTEARDVYGRGFTGSSLDVETLANSLVAFGTRLWNHLFDTPICNCPLSPLQVSQQSRAKGQFGMPIADAHEMLASLTISDAPLGYVPAKGPPIYFSINYNYREAYQPANPVFGNMSPKWTYNWLSYITENPTNLGNSVTRYASGGGQVSYVKVGDFATTGNFVPESRTGARLVRIPASGPTTSYELRYPDGKKEVFGARQSVTSTQARFFLTKTIDEAGNAVTLAYAACTSTNDFCGLQDYFRISKITDATGKVTTFQYTTPKQLISDVTDPYGRKAVFTYDSQYRLKTVTDVMGFVTTFDYFDGTNTVYRMTTPYGATNFSFKDAQSPGSYGAYGRSILITDPLGYTKKVEYLHGAPNVTASDPTSQVPTGLNTLNSLLAARNTFVWDKNAYANYSSNYLMARRTHWLHQNSNVTSGVPESIKAPLEYRVWFNYPDQPSDPSFIGSMEMPSAVGRVLEYGETQLSKYTYTSLGKVLTATDPKGRVTYYDYDTSGIDLLAIRQKNSATTTVTLGAYTYNAQHRPLTYTDAAGKVTTYTYNADGQLTSVKNPLNETMTYGYDASSRLSTISNSNNVIVLTLTYDTKDRVATSTDNDGYQLTYQYDAMDRIMSIGYPDGSTEAYAWNKLDLASFTDRQGRLTSYTYNANRQLTQMVDPQNRITKYSYFPDGQLKTLTDPRGKITSWAIDAQGRTISKTYPDNYKINYIYEYATSRLKQTTDALNQIRVFPYDVDDRPIGVNYTAALQPTWNIGFTWDPYFPRITQMTDGVGTNNYAYIPVGTNGALQVLSEDGPASNDTITYGYDALGRITGRTVNGSAEAFAYDSLSRATSHASVLGIFANTYLNQTGLVLAQTLSGSTVRTDMVYDTLANDRRLKNITHSPISGRSFSYGIGNDGRINTFNETLGNNGAWASRSWNYTYDPANRLTNAQSDYTNNYSYTYDLGDNITSQTSPIFATQTASFNDSNQNTALIYDILGNVRDDGVRKYNYDAENRLVGIGYKSVAGQSTALKYDGQGHMVRLTETAAGASTITNFLWCGNVICQKRDASNNVLTQYYPEGDYTIISAVKALYQRDHLGSVRNVLKPDATRLAALDYDPYGNLAQSTTLNGGVLPDFRYAGMFFHTPSGLYLTKYRAYDPKRAVWLTRDPIGEAGGVNLYEYVGNSPVNYIDPLGQNPVAAYIVYCAETPGCPQAVMTGAVATGYAIGKYSKTAWNATTSFVGGIWDWVFKNEECPPLPEKIIGNNGRSGGKRQNTDLPGVNPTPEGLYDDLTGGNGETLSDGTRVAPNGIRFRPGSEGKGPRIDIPANGEKPPETIHFPPRSN